MSNVTIWHNPRCSKSRQTLALLQENGIEPEVFLYLEEKITQKSLKTVIEQLGIAPWDLLRRKEAEFKEAGLTKDSKDADIIKAMVAYPKLIERPIVVKGEKAVLGRPPENVLELIG
jgi:arsenate reductase